MYASFVSIWNYTLILSGFRRILSNTNTNSILSFITQLKYNQGFTIQLNYFHKNMKYKQNNKIEIKFIN